MKERDGGEVGGMGREDYGTRGRGWKREKKEEGEGECGGAGKEAGGWWVGKEIKNIRGGE